MTNYCTFCYRIIDWGKIHNASQWYRWKLVGSAHLSCVHDGKGAIVQ